MSIRIPWAKPHFGPEELARIVETSESGWLSQGPRVGEFENVVAGHLNHPHCVAVSSGTAALDVALKLGGIVPGDEVLVPAFAYIATLNSVLYQGATPVFVDVEPETLTMDPEDARGKITARTRAAIIIDYGGHAASWDALNDMGQEYDLYMVEDAAPSFGGLWREKACGTLADVGTTSFHTAKVFTTVEGGMVFCASAESAKQVKIIRSQGESLEAKYVHPRVGHNYRMSDLHACVGLAQLTRFDAVLEARRNAAAHYSEGLSEVAEVGLPTERPGVQHAWFLFPVRVPRRDAVRARMEEAGIGTNVSWPHPGYAHDHLKEFFRGPCLVSEEACESVLCLPLFFSITKEEQDSVISSLIKAIEVTR